MRRIKIELNDDIRFKRRIINNAARLRFSDTHSFMCNIDIDAPSVKIRACTCVCAARPRKFHIACAVRKIDEVFSFRHTPKTFCKTRIRFDDEYICERKIERNRDKGICRIASDERRGGAVRFRSLVPRIIARERPVDVFIAFVYKCRFCNHIEAERNFSPFQRKGIALQKIARFFI